MLFANASEINQIIFPEQDYILTDKQSQYHNQLSKTIRLKQFDTNLGLKVLGQIEFQIKENTSPMLGAPIHHEVSTGQRILGLSFSNTPSTYFTNKKHTMIFPAFELDWLYNAIGFHQKQTPDKNFSELLYSFSYVGEFNEKKYKLSINSQSKFYDYIENSMTLKTYFKQIRSLKNHTFEMELEIMNAYINFEISIKDYIYFRKLHSHKEALDIVTSQKELKLSLEELKSIKNLGSLTYKQAILLWKLPNRGHHRYYSL